MFHHLTEEDGNTVWEFDAEGIDHLIDGLRELRDMEPGGELTTPCVVQEDDEMVGVAQHILRRHPDE